VTRLRLHRDESGFTLVEMMIALSMFTVVTVIFLTTLSEVQSATVRETADSVNNDQARLAMIELDREIRSGNVLYDPASETPSGFVLRIYTQSNANIRTPSPGYVCRLWRITTAGDLQTRYWPPNDPSQATQWITVASGIVNRTVSPPVTAFSRTDPASATGGRVVNITLLVNGNYAAHPTETVRIQQAITGRNTSYGFPVNVCSSTPS
jgi:prepilin-type N-terminal cleavage/methylation domain-containing protein